MIKSISSLTAEEKNNLLRAWGQSPIDTSAPDGGYEEIPEDISRRDVPVGVDRKRAQNISKNVASALLVAIKKINDAYDEIKDLAGGGMNSSQETYTKGQVLTLRYSLELALKNLREITGPKGLDIEKDVFSDFS